MASRTADGKHTPRFIVEFTTELSTYRSGNGGLTGHFLTREAAEAAIKAHGSTGVAYKVRQK